MIGASGWKAARRRGSRLRGGRHVEGVISPDSAAIEGDSGWSAPHQRPTADGADRLRRFPHLDVAVLDDTVYTTTRGLSPLGPLVEAAASSVRLPPRLESAAPAGFYLDDALPVKTIERTAVAVVTGECSHQVVIDHNATTLTVWQVERQVAEFNVLAGAARSWAGA